jgi:hypothetical protein
LPLIEDTALAQSCTDLCRQTVAATTKMSVEDVKKIVQELLKSCEERGIDIYEAQKITSSTGSVLTDRCRC